MGSHISLFAGVGMTCLAAEHLGYETVATAEIDPWCRKVLQRRFPRAFHLEDVKYVEPRALIGGLPVTRPLLVSGGFPCQDVSSAGTGLGLNGKRSGLWSEFIRVIKEFQPEAVLIENSPMLRSRGLDTILIDLHLAGYGARWDCIPAASVGAPHMRDRIFIVAWPERLWATGDVFAVRHDEFGYTDGHNLGVRTPDGKTRIRKFPRAGHLDHGSLIEDVPQATIRAAKQACLAHAVRCPATPTGAWPTPAASNPQDGESVESWAARRATLKAKGINGNGAGMPLSIAVRMFPTPTKSDGSGGPGTSPRRTGGKNLRTAIAETEGNGRLNPVWVEWMMGLPLGWTDPTLPDDCLGVHRGWGREPTLRTVLDGVVPDRAKRIRALGNGLVRQAAVVAMGMLP